MWTIEGVGSRMLLVVNMIPVKWRLQTVDVDLWRMYRVGRLMVIVGNETSMVLGQ